MDYIFFALPNKLISEFHQLLTSWSFYLANVDSLNCCLQDKGITQPLVPSTYRRIQAFQVFMVLGFVFGHRHCESPLFFSLFWFLWVKKMMAWQP